MAAICARRSKTVEAVRDYFNNLPLQTDDCWERTVAIVALGGMGKTETAYKFAEEFVETFQSVAWINAETETSALASFLGLAKYFKLFPHDQKEAELDLVRRVYCHIDEQGYGCTLFIFDNAIRLNPDEEEFVIIEYLHTDDLENKRFPNILITTQTQDWDRGIKTIQVDALSAEESLEFFRGTFRIQSDECDDLFRKLCELFEGYPLVMNLAVTQIDYNPNNGSVDQLRDAIQKYIGRLENEQSKLLNEKFNRAWPTKNRKTLSNVWELTFERIKQEAKGPDALKIMHFMSFLHVPIDSRYVIDALVRSSDCPLPAKKERYFQVKELFRLLEIFYTVRIFEINEDEDAEIYLCELGIHRLVQFVVRQQMDSTDDLERTLFYLARDCVIDRDRIHVNKSALKEVLQRSQLSQRALPYVGILACKGYPAACKIVETRQPETKAAATIWRLYYLERGSTSLSENQSYQRDDRTEVPGYFHLDCLDGVEGLATDLILNVHSVQDFICNCDSSYCVERNEALLDMTVKLSKTFIREDPQSSILTTDVISRTWFASFDRLRCDRSKTGMGVSYSFLRDMYQLFDDANVSQTRIAMLRTSLWDRGLATKLIEVLDGVSHKWTRPTVHRNFCYHSFLVDCMDVCMDGVDLRDERVQTVISSFCQMIARIEWTDLPKPNSAYTENLDDLAVHICSILIKLFLMDVDAPSHVLLQFLSSLKFLGWVQRNFENDFENYHSFQRSLRIHNLRYIHTPYKYKAEYFPKFIQRFSSSNIEEIQALLHFCQRAL